MTATSDLLRLLGDPARLRLLRVLARDRFNVSELTAILGLAQSGVSRHLGLLRDAGLVVEARDGAFTYYRVHRHTGDDSVAPLWAFLDQRFADTQTSQEARADDARLREVERLRRENFEQHAGAAAGEERRQLVPGRSWAAWSRALGLLLPALDVLDAGCGEGHLTLEVARWARQVIAVDRSQAVLDRAAALASRRRLKNVTWKRGDLQRLPVPAGAVDLVLLSQALHHASAPDVALAEAARVLRPGGRVLLQDLRPHGEEWVQTKLGDRWFGFADQELKTWLGNAGFVDIRLGAGTRRAGDPFAVVLACASTPTEPATRTRS